MSGNRGMKIAGWIVSVLVFLFLAVVSGSGKFIGFEGMDEMLAKMGLDRDLLFRIGILEVTLAVLYLIPRVAFLGAILLTGYLGGAVLTHLRIGDPFFFPIIIGVVMWIGLGLRDPRVFALAFGGSPKSASPPPGEG